jgi:hypothetical protein
MQWLRVRAMRGTARSRLEQRLGEVDAATLLQAREIAAALLGL